MRLDHVSFAAGPEGLAAAVQRIGSALGAGLADGGLHPRFGTRNFVLPLANGTYLEVVGHLDHPAVDKAPFGQAVKLRSEAGGGWLGWVVGVDDISAVEQRLGRPAAPGNRHRPDGLELQWRQIGVLDLIGDPALPFFIEWDVDKANHPSAGGGPCSIVKLELNGDAASLAQWLGQPGEAVLDGIELEWLDADVPGLVAVHVQTANGVVRLD